MRPVTLELNVLVRDPVDDNAWPGILTSITFNDLACPSVDGDTPTFLLELGFVVMDLDQSGSDSGSGVFGDEFGEEFGFSAGAGWTFYSQSEAADLIPAWEAGGLEWHAATKITCSNDPDNFWIVSNSFYDVQSAFSICCSAANIQTQAFALRQSSGPLVPGQSYPCGTEAIFKWLAIFGTNEPGPLNVGFFAILRDSGGNILTQGYLGVGIHAFLFTEQLIMNYPNDFIGISIGSLNIVANDAPDALGQIRVAELDGGTITLRTDILDGAMDPVHVAEATWALPNTNCGPNCILPYPDEGMVLPDANQNVPYIAGIQLQGDGPFSLNVITKPAWMTITLGILNGAVDFSGTPTTPANETVQFVAENCGQPIVAETPVGVVMNFTVHQVLEFTDRTPAANRTWYKVAYGAGLFVAIKQSGIDAQVMTSPDGIVWTSRVVPEDLNWNDVCWSPDLNLFVAVAQGGSATEIMTSPDGINWTARNQPGGAQWRAVCWASGIGLFVAVGTLGSSRVMTSPDGINWTFRTAAALNQWYGVTWSPVLNLLVAVGISGINNRVMTSPDGINWTSRVDAGGSGSWRKVSWGNGIFVAIADNGAAFMRAMISPDGINWTMQMVSSGANFTDLEFGGGIFVAVANIGGIGAQVIMSDDGINWIFVNATQTGWLGVAYDGASKFVIIGPNKVATGPWV